MATPKRAAGFDRNSQTFKDAKSIVGSKSDAPTPMGNTHHINIKAAANGVTVSHTSKATGKGAQYGGGDYAKEQEHVFTDPAKAHAHIGSLIGCPGCGCNGQTT